jgi:metal-responsive CopG/Arc/MetJ family transcriptional regulator
MKDVRMISAKVPPELLADMDEMQNSLNIETRNELITRAIRLYLAAYRFGLEGPGRDNTKE